MRRRKDFSSSPVNAQQPYDSVQASPENPYRYVAATPVVHEQSPYMRDSGPILDSQPSTKAKVVRLLGYISGSIYPICLLVSICSRGNIVSFINLLAFLIGATYSFKGRFIIGLTIVTALGSVAAQLAIEILNNSPSFISSTLIGVGFFKFHQTLQLLLYFGLDVLVLFASALQLTYVIKRDRYVRSFGHLPDVSRDVLRAADTKALCLSVELLETMVVFLTFVTGVSVPSVGNAIVYLIYVTGLVRWTFRSPTVTRTYLDRQSIYESQSRFSDVVVRAPYFFGALAVYQFLQLFSALVILTHCLYQIPKVQEQRWMLQVGEWLGFIVFPGSKYDWQVYIAVVSQVLLFWVLGALVRGYQNVDKEAAMFQQYPTDDHPLNDHESQGMRRTQTTRGLLRENLRRESMFTRMFLNQRGILFGSFIVIVWCTSYPSILTAAFFGWACIAIACYGLNTPVIFLPVMASYSLCLVVVEYAFNVPYKITTMDMKIWGLHAFQYPFADLLLHNIFVVLICWCCRSRLRYRFLMHECLQTIGEDAWTDEDRNSREDDSRHGTASPLLNDVTKPFQKWLADAEITALEYMDSIIMLTVFVVVLSTTVNILQAVYLVLAVLGQRWHRTLLLYSLIVSFAEFFWGVLCPSSSSTSDLIGLRCLDNERSWRSLWKSLWPQLLVIMQVVLVIGVKSSAASHQRRIKENLINQEIEDDVGEEESKEGEGEGEEESKEDIYLSYTQQPWYFCSRIIIEIRRLFIMHGLILCYALFLVVPIVYERAVKEKGTTTVFGTLQLVFLFTVLGTHLSEITKSIRGGSKTQRAWYTISILESCILLLRYVFQFKDIRNALENLWPFTSMTLLDVGLEFIPNTDEISKLFFYLLPTIILFGLSIAQYQALRLAIVPYGFLVAGRSLATDRLIFMVTTIQKLFYLHSAKITILVIGLVVFTFINALHLIYLGLVVLILPIKSWQNIWAYFYILSAMMTVGRYSFQWALFEPGPMFFSQGENATWIGFLRINRENNTAVWSIIKGNVYVALACAAQRISHLFAGSMEEDMIFTYDADRIRTSSIEGMADDDEMSNRSSLVQPTTSLKSTFSIKEETVTRDMTMDSQEDIAIESQEDATMELDPERRIRPSKKSVQFDVLPDQIKHLDTSLTPRLNEEGHSGLDSPSEPSHAQSQQFHEEEDGFFVQLREFFIQYANDAALDISILLLVISAFIHLDAIGLGYICFVGMALSLKRHTIRKFWWVAAILLKMIVVGQYCTLLWFPPVTGLIQQQIWPWRALSFQYQYWLCIAYQNPWALFVDFCVLTCLYLISKNKTMDNDTTFIHPSHFNLLRGTGNKIELHDDYAPFLQPQQIHPGDANDFTWHTKTSLWRNMQFVFTYYWIVLLLILVFVTGCLEIGIVSGCYLCLSLYMLYYIDQVEQPNSRLLTYLRRFNWLYLAALLLFQAPFFTDTKQTCTLGTNDEQSGACVSIYTTIGLFKYSVTYPGSVRYYRNLPIASIAIFGLILVQWQIFYSNAYVYIRAYQQREIMKKDSRRQILDSRFLSKRTRQWFHMQQRKALAIQRLKIIVSKLVNKVEELMDIAMGLNYSLPPMAPKPPVPLSATQNSVTLSWTKPEHCVHRIRAYHITRQTFPSLTLLGDFSDMVEVSGSRLEATMEGLRPGTCYQFKISALSRMGEGPFSGASATMHTQPLDLQGTSTSGWMKLRVTQSSSKKNNDSSDESQDSSWVQNLSQWINPAYWFARNRRKHSTRFIVMDKRYLTYYKDEQMALKHQSLKKRKKLKTSVMLRNVSTLRLSQDAIEQDEASMGIQSFQLTVPRSYSSSTSSMSGRCQIVIQPEAKADVLKWAQALAEAVPRASVHSSVLELLKAHDIVLPTIIVSQASQEYGDGSMSSASTKDDGTSSYVTGDESWNDHSVTGEDDEDDEIRKIQKGWWLAIYRRIYVLQDAVLRSETEPFDDDDEDYDEFGPQPADFIKISINAVRSNTANICYLSFVASFSAQGDVLNFIYVLSLFGFLLFENPRPKPKLWRFFLRYSFFVMSIRYLFQLPFFCQNVTSDFSLYPSIQPYCPSNNDYRSNQAPIQNMAIFGLYKFDGTVIANMNSLIIGLRWNFLVVLAILFHRHELRLRGIWQNSKFNSASASLGVDDVRASGTSSRDSIEDIMNMGQVWANHQQSGAPGKWSGGSGTGPSTPQPQTEAEITQNALADLHSEAQAQAQEIKNKRRTLRRSSTTVSKLNLDESTNEKEDDAQPVYLEASAEQSSPLRTWFFSVLPPKSKAYYSRLLPEPPHQWDKNIHEAITGTKPGRDYFGISFVVLLVSIIYLLLFYQELGEPEPDETLDKELSGQLSGYMVLAISMELCTIIWDRAAFMYKSLLSKLILQYTYVLTVHLSLWIVIPRYTKLYFQNRTAMVVYYLLKCVYMWFGAQQLKYGYVVFQESHNNNSDEKKKKGGQKSKQKHVDDEEEDHVPFLERKFKQLYEVYMFVPFAFEMKALLDYCCTNTSLKMSMFLLLEETNANLVIVKAEMEDRVEDAEILQGHRRQPLYRKLSSAGVILFLLFACLIGPLLLFSTANPGTATNKIEVSTVTFGVREASGRTNTFYRGRDTGSEGPIDINLFAEDVFTQRIAFSSFSQDIWSLSPPQRTNLALELDKPANDMEWILELEFQRDQPEGFQTVKYQRTLNMTTDQREALGQALVSTQPISNVIEITNFYFPVLQVTPTRGVIARTDYALRNVYLTKENDQAGITWWTLTSSDARAYTDENSTKDKISCPEQQRSSSASAGFCFASVSENVVSGLSEIGIGAYGITAAYIFVIFTIGSFVKEALRGALFEVLYQELPDPSDLLDLVEGIYIARQETYVGHLKDEVRLFETLIRIFRSPETLLRVTGSNIIHIPTAKDKID